jgi:hypothetical protein
MALKMTYQRVVSHRNSHTGRIDAQRFFAEQEIDIDNLDPLAKQKMMDNAASNLHLAAAVMLKRMVIEHPDAVHE